MSAPLRTPVQGALRDNRAHLRRVLSHAAIPDEVVMELIESGVELAALCNNAHLGTDAWVRLVEEFLTKPQIHKSSSRPLFARPLTAEAIGRTVELVTARMSTGRAVQVATELITHHPLPCEHWDALIEPMRAAAKTFIGSSNWPTRWSASELVPGDLRRAVASSLSLAVRAAVVADIPADDRTDAAYLLDGPTWPLPLSEEVLHLLTALSAARPGLAAEIAQMVTQRPLVSGFGRGPVLFATSAWRYSDELHNETLWRLRDKWTGAPDGSSVWVIDRLLADALWDPTIPTDIVDTIRERGPHRVPPRYDQGPFGSVVPSSAPFDTAPVGALVRLWNHPDLTEEQRNQVRFRLRRVSNPGLSALVEHFINGASPWPSHDPLTRREVSVPTVHGTEDRADWALLGDDPWAWRLTFELFGGGALSWDEAVRTAHTATQR